MDRPLLISTPLVRPTIDGRKTVTRRVAGLDEVNVSPGFFELMYVKNLEGFSFAAFKGPNGKQVGVKCPYGGRGTTLWVRETWLPLTNGYGYKADGLIRAGKIPGTNEYYQPRMTWKPSIHMPRKASRITLELLEVSIERAHDITEEDAKLEGVDRGILLEHETTGKMELTLEGNPLGLYRHGFIHTWITLNGRESWDKNPWVWRLSFKLLKCTTPWRTI